MASVSGIIRQFLTSALLLNLPTTSALPVCGTSPKVMREVTIEGCRSWDLALEESLARMRDRDPDRFDELMSNIKADSVDEYAKRLAESDQGILIDVFVTRSRVILQDVFMYSPEVADWQHEGVESTFFFRDVTLEQCEEMVEEQKPVYVFGASYEPCCDTIPPLELACALGVSIAWEAPQWVYEHGIDK